MSGLNYIRLLRHVLLLSAIVLLAFALDFWRRQQATALPSHPVPAVVFTGQFDRIQAALDLLDAGRIERLLISGVNAGAGLSAANLPSQFAFSPRMRLALQEGRLVFGEHAQDTLGNARETNAWWQQLSADQQSQGLVVITSRSHMPRASMALLWEMPRVTIYRWPTPDGANRALEFRKYVATALGYGQWWPLLPAQEKMKQ